MLNSINRRSKKEVRLQLHLFSITKQCAKLQTTKLISKQHFPIQKATSPWIKRANLTTQYSE